VNTLLKLASEHKIHPTQITRWKHEVIDNSAELFGKCTKKEVNHNPEVA
jgi:putative transposase